MRPTKEYIERVFHQLNEQCFGGELPMLPIVISSGARRLGALSYERKRKLMGYRNENFRMTISTRYDFAEELIRDTICHEMIHYYIAWKGIKDTSSHGRVFRQMMDEINRRFGFHLSVTHRMTDDEVMSARRDKLFLLCVSTLSDGRKAITIAVRTRLFDLWDGLPQLPGVVRTEWYCSRNPFFGKYHASQSPRAYYIDESLLVEHLADAKPLVRDGDTISVAKKRL